MSGVLAACSLSASAAHAVDGVVEINMASVAVGGITPGDQRDFPVSITVPGSYRLTTDLTQARQAEPMIIVSAANVTLDLNGFGLIGPASCGGGGICTPLGQAGLDGVFADAGAHNLSVLDGTVSGALGLGLDLQGLSARVIRVRAVGNASGGIRLGALCTASHVDATRNGGDGIHVGDGCEVSDSNTSANLDDGIEVAAPAGGGGSVLRNVAVLNTNRGIAVCGGALVSGNDVSRNSVGIAIGDFFIAGGCFGATGDVRDNRVVRNGNGVNVSHGASARVVGNTIIGSVTNGLQVDFGLLGAQAFAAYGGNVIRGSGSSDVAIGLPLLGLAETIELAPNVCGTDTTCP